MPSCLSRRILYGIHQCLEQGHDLHRPDFSHKFIVFYEYSAQENDDGMDYLIRTLQSEGCLRYEYTMKDKEGQFTTTCIDKRVHWLHHDHNEGAALR